MRDIVRLKNIECYSVVTFNNLFGMMEKYLEHPKTRYWVKIIKTIESTENILNY